MSLFSKIMYSNAKVRKYHQEFYGEYSFLNGIEEPSQEVIKRYQLQKLQSFQQEALSKLSTSSTQLLNNFLIKSGNWSNSSKDQILTQSLLKILEQIQMMVKSGYLRSNIKNEIINNQNLYQKIVNDIRNLYYMIENLSKQSGGIIRGENLKTLSLMVQNLEGVTPEQVLNRLFLIQGDILENLGVDWLSSKIPTNMKVYGTGKLNVSGKGQYISDILIMDTSLIDLNKNMEISYTINKKPYKENLIDFLKKLENYNDSKQIVIDSTAETLLQKLTTLGIQAKSGKNQLLWNKKSKNTWASIEGGGQNQYWKFLNSLEELQKSWDSEKKQIMISNPIYQSMANYQIANQLNKILHLNQIDNQFVLTPYGFQPYVQRILDLYHSRGGSNQLIFKFEKQIKLESGMCIKNRPVVMGI